MTSLTLRVKTKYNPEKALYKTSVNIVEDTSKVLTVKARREAPVDTGFLRSSIKRTYHNLTAKVYTFAYYAGFVEYGTMYMRANPYFRRAIEDTKRLLPTIISRAYRRHFK